MSNLAVHEDKQDSMLSIIERMAMTPDADIDKMEKLLAMKERIDAKNAEAEFNSAMSRVQKKVPAIQKNRTNDQTRSNFADLEQTNRAIIPVYTEEGFSLSFGTEDSNIEGYIRVICDVMHSFGHTKRYHLDLPKDDAGLKGNQNKTMVHASGSSISYARRYLVNMIFNLTTSDDNDGNGLGVGKELISKEQELNIVALMTEKGVPEERILNAYKVTMLANIPAKAYSSVISRLQATGAK